MQQLQVKQPVLCSTDYQVLQGPVQKNQEGQKTFWKKQKEKLPAELTDEEEVAIETGIANGLRARLFIEIEQATRTFALPRLRENDGGTRRSLTAAIDKLEHAVGLLRLNLNESAALEDFLLASLRLWTRR